MCNKNGTLSGRTLTCFLNRDKEKKAKKRKPMPLFSDPRNAAGCVVPHKERNRTEIGNVDRRGSADGTLMKSNKKRCSDEYLKSFPKAQEHGEREEISRTPVESGVKVIRGREILSFQIECSLKSKGMKCIT